MALTTTGLALFGTQMLQARFLGWPARRMVVAGGAFWVAGRLALLGTATMGAYATGLIAAMQGMALVVTPAVGISAVRHRPIAAVRVPCGSAVPSGRSLRVAFVLVARHNPH